MKELEISLFGRVQGVGFRYFISKQAKKNELKGIVMNKESGEVFIIAQGEERRLQEFILWLQKEPGFSKITGMKYYWKEAEKIYPDFRIVTSGNLLYDKAKSLVNLGKHVFGRKEVPEHIVIIPDGNRRWAVKNGLDSSLGHYTAASYEHIKELIEEAKKCGTKYITFWGFSTENWKRDKREVDSIFAIVYSVLEKFREDLEMNKIRFKHLGRKDRLPGKLLSLIEELEKQTEKYREFNLQICLDYGGREEILNAVNKILEEKKGKISEESFNSYLYSAGIPDPDLIIRTSGELRTSGLMPFQSAYAELYFSDKHFPDFGASDLKTAVSEFGRRQRRFGGK